MKTVRRQEMATFIVDSIPEIERDGEDQFGLLVNHARPARTRTLNDGDVIRVEKIASHQVDVCIEQAVSFASVVLTPGTNGNLTYGQRDDNRKEFMVKYVLLKERYGKD
jgi:hypothetical protein